jgi:hypothetical protein
MHMLIDLQMKVLLKRQILYAILKLVATRASAVLTIATRSLAVLATKDTLAARTVGLGRIQTALGVGVAFGGSHGWHSITRGHLYI